MRILWISVLPLYCMFPAFAQEPHSSKSHTYNESVYQAKNLITLEQAIEKAFISSARLQSAQAQIAATLGTQKQTQYWLNPNVGFEAENFAGSNEYHGTQSSELTYSISQTIEMGGKRTARKKSADAAMQVAQLNFQIEKINLARDVQIAYLNVLGADEALQITTEQEKLAQEILGNVNTRVAAAREPEIQLHKAKVALSMSIIKREQSARQLKNAKEYLAQFWNEKNLDLSLEHAQFFNINAPDSLEYYYSCLKWAPELTKYLSLREEKKSNLALEKAQAIPDPTFNAGVRNLRENRNHAFVLSVSLPLPIFNRNQGNISRAVAEINQIDSNQQETKRIIENYVRENWHNCYSAYQEAIQLKANVLPTAKKAFSVAYDGYQKGKYSYIEVLDAQRTLSEANSQYYDALKQYHSSHAELERFTKTVEQLNT